MLCPTFSACRTFLRCETVHVEPRAPRPERTARRFKVYFLILQVIYGHMMHICSEASTCDTGGDGIGGGGGSDQAMTGRLMESWRGGAAAQGGVNRRHQRNWQPLVHEQ